MVQNVISCFLTFFGTLAQHDSFNGYITRRFKKIVTQLCVNTMKTILYNVLCDTKNHKMNNSFPEVL